jgi:hypothetical protein
MRAAAIDLIPAKQFGTSRAIFPVNLMRGEQK